MKNCQQLKIRNKVFKRQQNNVHVTFNSFQKRSPKMSDLCVKIFVETFRFLDENDYEDEL